jgi:hypothetical protein
MPDLFLRQGAANPSDVILRDPTQADAGGAITAIIAETQALQTEAIQALEKYIGTIAESQAAQSEAIVAAERYIASVAESQATQSEAITAVERYLGTIVEAQIAQTESISGTVGADVTAAIVEVQAPQSEAILAHTDVPTSEVFGGGVWPQEKPFVLPPGGPSAYAKIREVQAAQTESISGDVEPRFDARLHEAQARQGESVTTSLTLFVRVVEAQAKQRDRVWIWTEDQEEKPEEPTPMGDPDEEEVTALLMRLVV